MEIIILFYELMIGIILIFLSSNSEQTSCWFYVLILTVAEIERVIYTVYLLYVFF